MKWLALVFFIVALLYPVWGAAVTSEVTSEDVTSEVTSEGTSEVGRNLGTIEDDSDDDPDFTSRYAALALPVPQNVDVTELLDDLVSRSNCPACGGR